MKILNLGSLNVDYVYDVAGFVRAGETISSSGFHRFAGGKGLNQSIALAHAGAEVMHLGKVGHDGVFLLEKLERAGTDISFVEESDDESGHAIIQVNRDGENCIIIHGGSNRRISRKSLPVSFAKFAEGDFFLSQNETNLIPEALAMAKRKGMKTAFNPAPMTEDVATYPLGLVDILILNESEAASLFDAKTAPEKRLDGIRRKHGFETIVLTLGSKGAILCEEDGLHFQPARKVKAVDTTAAGDCFVGFFLAEKMRGSSSKQALAVATAAAALCVQRKGASDSIPLMSSLRGVPRRSQK
jgi:ribokinase